MRRLNGCRQQTFTDLGLQPLGQLIEPLAMLEPPFGGRLALCVNQTSLVQLIAPINARKKIMTLHCSSPRLPVCQIHPARPPRPDIIPCTGAQRRRGYWLLPTRSPCALLDQSSHDRLNRLAIIMDDQQRWQDQALFNA